MTDNRINFVHYLTGYLFYSTLGYATYDCINKSHFQQESPSTYSFALCGLFLIASYIQYQSHVILAQLRTDKAAKTSTNHDYHIPRGGLFNLIACPHYFSEIII